MAQKTEKEETEFKVVPETITPCVNNCGVTGNPATNNMCQKCFNATSSASTSSSSSSSSSTSSSVTSSVAGAIKFGEKSPRSSSSKRLSPERTTDLAEIRRDLKEEVKEASSAHATAPATAAAVKREVNRCSGCRRKVGLTGFRCRCGELFCAEHRYSDRHDCSYDYKAAGREAIARENPVVKAAKLVKL
ncbi:unnamed protein product [Coffea canephora]|uniref:Zinc finger A20 and AN1 domain-containing stress-associated protein 5-like n=2 Tax=Coffea TaxID=13442 RepID=A0A068UHS4_COFCA|nr:zinc finger A20 and AN1 domain-containing stress-associated protein 5-like [Coffea arabica]CDP07749.1 unnamed protein product [Coffea canephora]